MNTTEILNGADAEREGMELESLVRVLGDQECQRAVRFHTLPVTIARAQIEE
ncbi:hypothetical protein [Streptomyces sp. I8-5]|uniref:hypothetical protein n=1 Tax=Streptomyces sp. I8-5 TaxID=3104277 RepID=UPI00386D5E82